MIPLYLSSAEGNQVIAFDDPAIDTDLGSAFTARLVSVPFTGGFAGGWARFRRFVQTVFLENTATVTITPIVDGSEAAADAQTSNISAGVSGAEFPVTAKFAKGGSRFQVAIEVTAHEGRVGFGEWERWVKTRRTTRS